MEGKKDKVKPNKAPLANIGSIRLGNLGNNTNFFDDVFWSKSVLIF